MNFYAVFVYDRDLDYRFAGMFLEESSALMSVEDYDNKSRLMNRLATPMKSKIICFQALNPKEVLVND